MDNSIKNISRTLVLLLTLIGSAIAQTAHAADTAPAVNPDLPPIPLEDVNVVQSLPAVYPEHWFMVHDVVFSHFLSGKVLVIDADEDALENQIKGTAQISLIGSYVQATKRPEIYVVETFYTRGTRGKRTDVVTIYDKENLTPVDEIVLRGEKRMIALPQRYATRLVDDEKRLVIFNFSPAASITVVDLESRKIVDEFGIPGCVLAHPTGQRSITSLCSNGGLLTSVLDKEGKLLKQERIAPFFNSDVDPIIDHTAVVNGVAYFFGFTGEVHPINLKGEIAKVGKSWSLVSQEEAAANWRPGGVIPTDQDELGHFYVLMHPDGKDGTRQHGGPEVWVFDAKKKKRTQRIKLNTWGISVALSRGKKPLMMVTNAEMGLDIYDALKGKYLRTVKDIGLVTPLEARGSR